MGNDIQEKLFEFIGNILTCQLYVTTSGETFKITVLFMEQFVKLWLPLTDSSNNC